MSPRTAVGTDEVDGSSACWCCGARKPETRLLRLGARPEAAVCVECVAHLRQRALAHEEPPAVVRHLHAAANQVRDVVTAVGLHNQPLIGPALRWINQRSPF
jgi:hypothetical protein